MKAFFITAIGTEIGKTYVSALLLRAWRSAGRSVHALKPVMSGFGEDELAASDAGRLLSACGGEVTAQSVAGICLHRFEAPLAPNVAMRQAGVPQDYRAILGFTRRGLTSRAADRILVEGAGGVMSPLTDDALQLDLMADLGLPVVLVAAPYLGAVSHTLSAIDALRGRGLAIESVLVSQPDPAGASPEALGEEVERFRVVEWGIVSHGAQSVAMRRG